jgi:stress response protein YsnF
VRLAKDTITDEQQISEEVRKEQIDVDDESRRP